MSSKKIIRLKTPTKSRDEGKLSECTQLSGIEFNQQSTILLVRNVACSEELQVTLINEINKLYREINKLKLAAEEETKAKEQTAKEGRIVRNKLEVLEREYAMYREMYELEKENHERLRRFYEMREKEWMGIVNEHRKILEEYDQRSNNSVSDIETKSEYTQLESMYANLEEMLSHSYLKEQAPKEVKEVKEAKQPVPERRGRKKLRSSIDREDSLSEPKLRLKLASHKDTSFYTDNSVLQEERKERTPFKLRHEHDSLKLISRGQPIAQKNAQADELFDSIVRKTYYRYKEKSIPVSEIEQLEDMIKLKNAKTSTKERLLKTIRKLDFPISNDQELKVLCECVERAVLEKYKTLRGDYAFDLLIDKLKECQKLALSSNSELQRLDPKSQMTNMESELRSKCLYNDPSILKESDIYRGGQKSIELLLDSTIKSEKNAERMVKAAEDDLSQRIKFSGINLRKDSELHDPSGLGVQSRYISDKGASVLEPSQR